MQKTKLYLGEILCSLLHQKYHNRAKKHPFSIIIKALLFSSCSLYVPGEQQNGWQEEQDAVVRKDLKQLVILVPLGKPVFMCAAKQPLQQRWIFYFMYFLGFCIKESFNTDLSDGYLAS